MAGELQVEVGSEVFEAFPDYRRGIVLATGIDNEGTAKELEEKLDRSMLEARASPVDLDEAPEAERWREAHEAFGSDPHSHPPAHVALRDRVQSSRDGVPFVNNVVAVMNRASIENFVPVGGDDVGRAGDHLLLTEADGDESFAPLGQPDRTQTPEPGEIVYKVGGTDQVMCRRWNWRNSHETRIRPGTEVVVMNVDVLGSEAGDEARRVGNRVADMLATYCDADTRVEILTPEEPRRTFDLPP